MNEDIIKGKWHQLKGAMHAKWGELTNDQLDIDEGSFEKLSGMLQERYGYEKDIAKKQIDDFIKENKLK